MAFTTENRRKILEVLAAGPIHDSGGRAIQKLQAETGHETTNALSKVLRTMEQLGLVTREINGRRTFSIEATAEGLSWLGHPTPVPVPEPEVAVDDFAAAGQMADMDMDQLEVLAGVLLKTCLRAMKVQENGSSLTKDEAGRLRRALLSAETRTADAEATVKALRAEVRAKGAELIEVKSSLSAASQTITRLMADLDKPKNRRSNSVADILSVEELAELQKLQRSLPNSRG